MKRVWDGEVSGHAGPVGPPPVRPAGPKVLVGGRVDAASSGPRGTATVGSWAAVPPGAVRRSSPKVDEALAAGRARGQAPQGGTRLLRPGPERTGDIEHSIKHYYAWLGDIADQIAASVATSAEMVQGYLQAFENAGCDELIFFPASKDPAQVDLLADAAGLGR